MLRTRGASERCNGVRGISVPLQRGCEPPASLDSRGLAACAMAAVGRSGRTWPFSKKSALDAVPMEAPRQPSAQSRACGADTPAAARLDGLGRATFLDLLSVGDHPGPFFDSLHPWSASEAGRCAPWAAFSCIRPFRRLKNCPSGIYARLPALRGVLQSGRDCAHLVADSAD